MCIEPTFLRRELKLNVYLQALKAEGRKSILTVHPPARSRFKTIDETASLGFLLYILLTNNFFKNRELFFVLPALLDF